MLTYIIPQFIRQWKRREGFQSLLYTFGELDYFKAWDAAEEEKKKRMRR